MIFRLIPLMVLIVLLLLAFTCVILAIRSFATTARTLTGDHMPKAFRTLAYTALIVLMFGVTTGWLGAA